MFAISSSKLSVVREMKSIISFIKYDYNRNAFIAGHIKLFLISLEIDFSFSQYYKKFKELFKGVLSSCENDYNT